MVGHRVDAATLPLEALVGAGGDGMHVDHIPEVKILNKGAIADIFPPGSTSAVGPKLCSPAAGRVWGLSLG